MSEAMQVDASCVEPGSQRIGSDKVRLQNVSSELVHALDMTEIRNLVDLLFSKMIFNTEETNRVFYTKVPEDKMRVLLKILSGKVNDNKDILDTLADFLRNTCEKEDLAKRLMEDDGIHPENKEIEEAIRLAEGMKLTDRILSGILRFVGSSWQNVAIELGVTQIKIENITYDIKDSYEQKFRVFHHWIQKFGYFPDSLITLLKAFKNTNEAANDTCSVNWNGICDYLKKVKNNWIFSNA